VGKAVKTLHLKRVLVHWIPQPFCIGFITATWRLFPGHPVNNDALAMQRLVEPQSATTMQVRYFLFLCIDDCASASLTHINFQFNTYDGCTLADFGFVLLTQNHVPKLALFLLSWFPTPSFRYPFTR
jgi:hypothetical protein